MKKRVALYVLVLLIVNALVINASSSIRRNVRERSVNLYKRANENTAEQQIGKDDNQPAHQNSLGPKDNSQSGGLRAKLFNKRTLSVLVISAISFSLVGLYFAALIPATSLIIAGVVLALAVLTKSVWNNRFFWSSEKASLFDSMEGLYQAMLQEEKKLEERAARKYDLKYMKEKGEIFSRRKIGLSKELKAIKEMLDGLKNGEKWIEEDFKDLKKLHSSRKEAFRQAILDSDKNICFDDMDMLSARIRGQQKELERLTLHTKEDFQFFNRLKGDLSKKLEEIKKLKNDLESDSSTLGTAVKRMREFTKQDRVDSNALHNFAIRMSEKLEKQRKLQAKVEAKGTKDNKAAPAQQKNKVQAQSSLSNTKAIVEKIDEANGKKSSNNVKTVSPGTIDASEAKNKDDWSTSRDPPQEHLTGLTGTDRIHVLPSTRPPGLSTGGSGGTRPIHLL